MSEAENAPQGVIAILTDPHGSVWATAADFGTSAPGGYKLRAAQEQRAERMLAFAFVRAAMPQAIVGAFEAYDAEQLIRRLCRRDKDSWRVTIKAIGYDNDR